MSGRPKNWMRATPDTECVDIWLPGQLTPLKRHAYDRLAELGEIRPVSVSQDPAGRTVVRYLAAAPQIWERQAMGEFCREEQQLTIRMDGGGSRHVDGESEVIGI